MPPATKQQPAARAIYPWIGKIFGAWSTPLHTQASKASRRLVDLPRDKVVTVLEASGGWLKLQTKVQGKSLTGYVSGELVAYVFASIAAAGEVLRAKAKEKQVKGTAFKLSEADGALVKVAITALEDNGHYLVDKNTYAVSPARVLDATQQALLDRIRALGSAAALSEGSDGARFQKATTELVAHLRQRIEALLPAEPLPDDLNIVFTALAYWQDDLGDQWGEGSYDSKDLKMSAPDYAKVPASQYKCNAYVAEVLYRSLNLVLKTIKSETEKGKYFPYQARQWGDSNLIIPGFPVASSPALGDIWSNGSHTGIFLGEYANSRLYISARDDGSGVFGLDRKLQYKHGIQIKLLPDGGVFRHYSR